MCVWGVVLEGTGDGEWLGITSQYLHIQFTPQKSNFDDLSFQT